MPSKHMRESGSSEPPLEIVALKSTQKGFDLYTANLVADDLWRVAYTLPKSRDDPKELERQLAPSKVSEIASYVEEKETLLPNNLIVNVTATEHVKVVPVNEKLGVYKLQFTPWVGTPAVDGDELPLEKTGKYGYLVDGQHRGVGTHQSSVAGSLPLVVTLLWNVPQEIAYRTFADINENQKKVSKLLVTFVRHEIDQLDPYDSVGFDIVEALNEKGVLKDKIKVYPDDKGRWVNSHALIAEIRKLIEPAGVLHPIYAKARNGPLPILEDYFEAFAETFPTAWGSQTHVLTKGMGFAVMLRIFERAYRRCDFFEGRKHAKANLKNQITALVGMHLDVEGTDLPLEWDSGRFGGYSSGAGINAITAAILAHPDFQERP